MCVTVAPRRRLESYLLKCIIFALNIYSETSLRYPQGTGGKLYFKCTIVSRWTKLQLFRIDLYGGYISSESGLAGRVGTKFRTLKTGSRLHGRIFGGAEGVFDASPECFRKSKSLLMQVSFCFRGSKLCPNSPRQSRLAPLYGRYTGPVFYRCHSHSVGSRTRDAMRFVVGRLSFCSSAP